MLESITQSNIDGTLSLDNLQKLLRKQLTGKRYLLVMDDIWNESFEKWDQLRTYLMCGAQGSKILVTTRSKTVAQTMGVSDPYVLKGLTPEESWGLLKKITFRDDTVGLNRSLDSIGKKIAKKSSGVPLAIKTLGGLLQGKSEGREWTDVLQGAFWKSCEVEESIMPMLKLSYQKLSPQLRQCFAYCSLYPKDWEIKKDELIQLWMAQGYLECSDEKQHMEDIGNQFVKTFLMKSFFQDAKIDDRGDIDTCKMHDLIHDLAMKVAGNDCCYVNSDTKRLEGSPIHIMLKSDAFGLLESLDTSRMRTLILLRTLSKKLNEEELSVISKFKYLRVLKLKLSDCSLSLKYLPPLERLPFLKSLSIFRLNQLEFIYYEEPLLSESFFPSLEKLTIVMCYQLRGWRRMSGDVNDDDDNSSESYHLSFPRLSELVISQCSRLTHMPTFPKLDEHWI
ncbi:CC-NBS-LRR resistance protein [Trifolium medium]|uniref:CC-NBS-LRR resistance protein n=1 Tax=Trifolium medium TaxID=97028 RepID=A0A392M2S5_9FABA|nr:CC-NBS-LRR resistance protein [Trifolium medium]